MLVGIVRDAHVIWAGVYVGLLRNINVLYNSNRNMLGIARPPVHIYGLKVGLKSEDSNTTYLEYEAYEGIGSCDAQGIEFLCAGAS